MNQVLALIDANSFYCSCERVFDPKLEKRPVLVLSNNDGCAIARTKEVKALGIKMGDPFFKIRDLCKKNNVAVFSSNYTLYGDMSARMNAVYREFSPDIEIYSVDESFLDLTGFETLNLAKYALDLRMTVKQWTGMPTCVGLGPTKTIAKLANWTAKHYPELNGICDMVDPAKRAEIMKYIPVGEVWGVGRASQEKLWKLGIKTVSDLASLDTRVGRQVMTVVGERTIQELRGIPCIALEQEAPERKGCAVTRMFGSRLTDQNDVMEAMSFYAERLSEKLRKHGMGTNTITAFYYTSPFDRGPQYHAQRTYSFSEATNNSSALIKATRGIVTKTWRSGMKYSKGGVMTSDLVPLDASQRVLFDFEDREKSGDLMEALDKINLKYGRGTLVHASSGVKKAWQTRFNLKSPRYTTRIDELPVAFADGQLLKSVVSNIGR